MFYFWEKKKKKKKDSCCFTINVFRFWNKSLPAIANANTNWRRRKTNYETTFTFAVTVGWSHLRVTLVHLLGNRSNNYNEVKFLFAVVCSCMQFYLRGGKFMAGLVWSVWWHYQLIYGLSRMVCLVVLPVCTWLSRMVCLVALPVDTWFVSYGLSCGITIWYMVSLVWSVWWDYQLIYLVPLRCALSVLVGVTEFRLFSTAFCMAIFFFSCFILSFILLFRFWVTKMFSMRWDEVSSKYL